MSVALVCLFRVAEGAIVSALSGPGVFPVAV